MTIYNSKNNHYVENFVYKLLVSLLCHKVGFIASVINSGFIEIIRKSRQIIILFHVLCLRLAIIMTSLMWIANVPKSSLKAFRKNTFLLIILDFCTCKFVCYFSLNLFTGFNITIKKLQLHFRQVKSLEGKRKSFSRTLAFMANKFFECNALTSFPNFEKLTKIYPAII